MKYESISLLAEGGPDAKKNTILAVQPHTQVCAALEQKLPPAPQTDASSSPALLSGRPTWMRERARILQRICESVEDRRARGMSLHKALRRPAWAWKSKTYKSGKPVRLTEGTLARLYYAWRANGRTPEAFALGYKFTRKPISAALATAFIKANAREGVTSMQAAFSELCRTHTDSEALKGISERMLVESLSPELRAALCQAHWERRKRASQERKLGRQLEALANQIQR